jgi:serine phosphatase RsbU (regulator of sigma subunit)/anti-sigma regulatory factor (Ser/Thr protein kinase)
LFRRIPIPVIAGVSILITVIFIGVGAFFAQRAINETVLEEFRSQQLQLTTSAAQQTESYFNDLNIEVISLAQDTSIRTSAPDSLTQTAAISFIENAVSTRPEAVLSVTRFDATGEPRYAYPDEYNQLANAPADDEAAYPYNVPQGLIDIAQTRASANVPTSVYRVELNDQPGQTTYLLITPVNTFAGNTEFLVYELNMDEILSETLALTLDDLTGTENGQVWVLDEVGGEYRAIYEGIPGGPTVTTIRDSFSTDDFSAVQTPQTEEYTVGDSERAAALARADIIGRPFVIMVSRDTEDALSVVSDDLRGVLLASVAAIVALIIFGAIGTQRIVSETSRRQAETGARATARSMLEVSRALNSTLEIDIVLDRILVEFERLIPYYSASILLLTDDGLEVAAHRGEDEEAHQKVFGLDEARAAREVIARGHPVIINDTKDDERWTAIEGSEISSWMGLPLKVFDRSVGVLNINGAQKAMFTPQDVSLAETFADQASVALQNARLHQIEVKRIEQELTIARSIQSSLQPEVPPEFEDLEIAFEWLPARQVSGDFLQIVPLVDNQIALFVGDVSGKGMPAAMIMAVITTALRDEVNRFRNPGELLSRLNTRLFERLKQNNMNSALLAALYNPTSNTFSIANAGMGLPYLREDNGWSDVAIGGYPLGSSDNATYGMKTAAFGEGAYMVLYSDGIVEAQNSRGEFFGFERLEALLNELPDDLSARDALERILAAVREHLGRETPQDDITVMVIRSLYTEPEPTGLTLDLDFGFDEELDERTWQEKYMSRQGANEQREGYQMPRENVEVFLPSTLGYEKVARDAAEAIAREMGFSDDRIDDLKTAVAEACMNAIEHGNLEDRSTSVTVLLSAAADSLEVRVEDRGRQIIPNPLPAPGGEDKSRGWGMFFIQNLMDEVEITELPEGGNLVKMTIYLGTDKEDEDESSSED